MKSREVDFNVVWSMRFVIGKRVLVVKWLLKGEE